MTRLDLTRCGTVLALCLGANSGVLAAPADVEPGHASQSLRQAPYFAVGTVGVAGTLSDEEKALQLVLRQPDAGKLLLEVLEDPHATREGRLYALLGLRHLEFASQKRATASAGPTAESQQALREKVRLSFSKYRAAAGEVGVIRGCSILSQPIADVAKSIDQGLVRVSPPSSTAAKAQGNRPEHP